MKNPRALSLAPVICAIPLLGWWMYGLFDLDEGFYAAVVAEMNRRGEWITPFYNGNPWFEKPVLLYWIAKPTLAMFGGEFGIRLPSILACLATYGLIAWFGKRRLGPSSGIVAALVLATSVLFVVVGRMVLVDPLLIACLTGAFLTFWESLAGDRRWRLASAALLGMAVLAKGPVACLLFILVVGYTCWRERELRPAFGGLGIWVLGTLIFAGVVAAWYLPAYLANHRLFVDEFLIKQNVQRFKGGDEAHSVPMPTGLIYYIPFILVGMIPWSLFIPRAWPRRNDEDVLAPVRRYLATWAVVVFGFFTLSGTKLPHYVLPCFPPLALLVGHDLAIRWQGLSRLRTNFFAIGSAALAAILTFGFRTYYEAANSGPKRIAEELIADAPEQDAGYHPRQVAMFRLGKQPDGLYPPVPKPKLFGAWEVRINETSLPSTLFYLDALFRGSPPYSNGQPQFEPINPVVIETDDPAALVAGNKPLCVITRPGRLTTSDDSRLLEKGDAFAQLNLNAGSTLAAYSVERRPNQKQPKTRP